MAQSGSGENQPGGFIVQPFETRRQPSFQSFDADRHEGLVVSEQDDGTGGAKLGDGSLHRRRGAVINQVQARVHGAHRRLVSR